jgi:predicted HicB family RNase H-like nuclease
MTQSIMQYTGYTALIQYSEEEKCLIGDVIGIKHTIFFRGSTHEEVYDSFKEMIDDYPAACAEQGIRPCDPPSEIEIKVLIPNDIHTRSSYRPEHKSIPIQALMQDALQQVVT